MEKDIVRTAINDKVKLRLINEEISFTMSAIEAGNKNEFSELFTNELSKFRVDIAEKAKSDKVHVSELHNLISSTLQSIDKELLNLLKMD